MLRPWGYVKEPNLLTSFNDLGLVAPILKALATEGYTTPTPIQTQAIPHVLAGRDLLGIAQTGTGKTAAFALPILQRLAAERKPAMPKTCRALILSPTRELATQIADSFGAYGRNLGLRRALVFGGVAHSPQIRALAGGVDVLVATPGRLLDHLESRALRLDRVEILVLDEADHMLDMGFIHAVRRIVKAIPAQRQNLFFSATMPKEIGLLAGELLRDPAKVAVAPEATTVERVTQSVAHVDQQRKPLLLATLVKDLRPERMLVFTRTKHGADRVVRQLEQSGFGAVAIHGNKSQGQRERALDGFKTGKTPILIATDIAARGIDVDGVSHVVNYDLPNVPETYVHRIGRTARAGASGEAIAFCSGEEKGLLKDIERLIGQRVPIMALPASIPAPRPGSEGERSPSQAPGRGRPQQSFNGRNQHGHGGRPNSGGGRPNSSGPRRGTRTGPARYSAAG